MAGGAPALQDRVLKQLARELLLAQSSDWAFLMRTGTAREYATQRTLEHLARFKVPRSVLFGPLPKTSTGKIQKFVLRERAKGGV